MAASRLRRARGLLLALAVVSAGCAGKSKNEAVVKPVARELVLRPRPGINGGRPVYVLVRSIDESEFLADSYRKISAMVYPNSGDPSVLAVALIWPNRGQRVQVYASKDKAIAVYAMFAAPGDQWKLLLGQPLRTQYLIRLDGYAISLERPPGTKDADL